MINKDIQDLSIGILNLEKERVKNLHWADLTFKELELIDDSEKKREYRKLMLDFHMRVINTFSTLVSKDFKFSVPNERLTYRIMATDYMNYFYSKGMTREEIIKMMSNSKTTIQHEEKHI